MCSGATGNEYAKPGLSVFLATDYSIILYIRKVVYYYLIVVVVTDLTSTDTKRIAVKMELW